jgi:methionine synthase II (cobalamin-independent)
LITSGRVPVRNAWDDYVRALQVASDWLALARQSHDPRHRETALACVRIARERLDRLLAEGLDAVHRHELHLMIELAAQTADGVDEVRQSIAESRALRDHPVRRLPGAGSECA